MFAPAAAFNSEGSTLVRGGRTAIASASSIFIITVLASSFPEYVSERCDPLSGVGSRVGDGHVLDVLTIEKAKSLHHIKAMVVLPEVFHTPSRMFAGWRYGA